MSMVEKSLSLMPHGSTVFFNSVGGFTLPVGDGSSCLLASFAFRLIEKDEKESEGVPFRFRESEPGSN